MVGGVLRTPLWHIFLPPCNSYFFWKAKRGGETGKLWHNKSPVTSHFTKFWNWLKVQQIWNSLEVVQRGPLNASIKTDYYHGRHLIRIIFITIFLHTSIVPRWRFQFAPFVSKQSNKYRHLAVKSFWKRLVSSIWWHDSVFIEAGPLTWWPRRYFPIIAFLVSMKSRRRTGRRSSFKIQYSSSPFILWKVWMHIVASAFSCLWSTEK